MRLLGVNTKKRGVEFIQSFYFTGGLWNFRVLYKILIIHESVPTVRQQIMGELKTTKNVKSTVFFNFHCTYEGKSSSVIEYYILFSDFATDLTQSLCRSLHTSPVNGATFTELKYRICSKFLFYQWAVESPGAQQGV